MIHLLAFLWGWADATVSPIAPDVLLTLLAPKHRAPRRQRHRPRPAVATMRGGGWRSRRSWPHRKVYAVQWAWQHRPLLPFLLVTIAARGALIAASLRRRVRERTLVTIHLLFWTALYTTTFASASAAMWRVS